MTAIHGIMAGLFSSFTAKISDQTISVSGDGSIGVGYTIKNDGTVIKPAPDEDLLETWLMSGSAASFDVRATLQAGSTPGGTLGTWLNLATDRGWAILDSVNDGTPVTCTLLIELSPAGGGTAFDSATISLSANRTS